MLNKRLIWILGMLIAVFIGGCAFFTAQQPAAAQQATPEPLVEHTLPEPITMTVASMSWLDDYTITFADAGRIFSGWNGPEGDEILINIEKKPFGDGTTRNWYTIYTDTDRGSRHVYSSGIGTDPKPASREVTLAHNEYIHAHDIGYFIRLVDSTGQEWLWMPRPDFYQLDNYAEILAPIQSDEDNLNFYLQFEVGMEVVVTDYFSQRGLHDVLIMEPAP